VERLHAAATSFLIQHRPAPFAAAPILSGQINATDFRFWYSRQPLLTDICCGFLSLVFVKLF
jgi:hypothetical protein